MDDDSKKEDEKDKDENILEDRGVGHVHLSSLDSEAQQSVADPNSGFIPSSCCEPMHLPRIAEDNWDDD